MVYSDLATVYAATAKERDELKAIVERQCRINRAATTLALELDAVIAERDRLAEDNKRLNEALESMRRDLECMARLKGVTNAY